VALTRSVRRMMRPQRDGLQASITRVEGRNVELGTIYTRPWQHLAWDYWAALPELMDPTLQQATLLSTLMKWRVLIDGQELPDGTVEGEPDLAGEALDQATEGLGVAEAIRLIALNLQVAAELWYVLRIDEGWWCYSIVDPELNKIRDRPDWERLHVKIHDPRDQRYALGRFAAVIGPAEELLTYGAQSRSQSRSRLVQAGILLRPQEASFPDSDMTDPLTGQVLDTFGRDLHQAMTAPIRNEHDPSAQVPIDAKVPKDTVEAWRWLIPDRPYDDKIQEKADKAAGRIGIALDIEAEQTGGGISEMNHWSAWLSDERGYKLHTQPLGERVGEVLAAAIEVVNGLEEGMVEVLPDAAELLARRSTVRDALQAASIGAVGLRYVRDAIGATEEDAPTEEDIALMMMMRARNPDTLGPDDVEAAGGAVDPQPTIGPPGGEGSPVAAALGAGQRSIERIAVDTSGQAVAAAAGPTTVDRDLERLSEAQVAFDVALRDRLLGSMEMAVVRARERVGARLRTALRSAPQDAPERVAIDGLDNADVAAALGATRVYQLVDVDATVRDSFGNLARWWDERITVARRQIAALTGLDTSSAAWDEAQAASVEKMVDMLTDWTVAELSRTTADMGALPAAIAREALAAAGGTR
jgi:hypothetical protein